MTDNEQAARRQLVALSLAEDLGSGDVTARLIPADQWATATVICRQNTILCGRRWFDETFQQLSSNIRIDWHVDDGDEIPANTILCRLSGPARALLSGERTALNLLQTLSATATRTAEYRRAIGDRPVTLLDTRKTIPGLRLAQKYAVRCGGGNNHRIGLYDAILIKENHIAACGSVGAAIESARKIAGKEALAIEVEVEDLEELTEALRAGADKVLLDNFTVALLKEAVELRQQLGSRCRFEVSGGIRLDTIQQIAATGIDDISVGALTKDVQAIDLSMRIEACQRDPVNSR